MACGDNNFPDQQDAGLDDSAIVRSLDTMAPAQVKAGDPITVTCILTENDVPRMVTGQVKVTDEASVERTSTTIIARKVGTVTVECSLPELSLVDETPATVEIVHGDPATIVTTITPDPVTAGETATATCEVFDSSGNLIEDAAPELVLSPTDPGNTITGLTALMTRAGHYAAICSLPGATSNNAPFDVIPALPSTLLLGKQPNNAVHALGELITITHVVADRFGNEIPTANVALTSTGITGAGPIISLPPDVFRYNGEGRYRVNGTVTDPTDGGAPVTAELELLVNSVGPRIQCANDATMIDLTPGAPLTITGDANDVNGVTSIAVNGTPVTVGAGNSFSSTITTRFGLNFVDVTAVDDFGATTSKVCTFLVANRWASPTGIMGDALSLKLTQNGVDDGNRNDGLDSFGDVLYTVINSSGIRSALHNALLDANPLKPSSCDVDTWLGCAFRSRIDYLESNIVGSNTVSLTLVSGGIRATARINDVNVKLQITGTIDTTGWVHMSYIDVSMILDTTLASGLPRITVRPNSVTAGVGSISTDFSGVAGWIIDEIIVPLAQSTLQNTVRDLIRNYVSTNFNQVLDGIISGLDISTLGTSFNVPRLDGSGNVQLGFGVGFSLVGANANRLLFGIGTSFTSTSQNAYATLGTPLPPGVNLTDPSVSLPSNIALGAHVGILNQALHALWKANYFSASLNGTQLGGLPAEIQLVVDTKLPGVSYINTDGTVALQLGALDVQVNHPDLPANLVITLGLDAHASVSLLGNDLKFGSIVVDQVYISTESVALTAEEQMVIEDLIGELAQELVNQSLNNSLPALPIPSFPLPSSLTQFGLPAGASLGVKNPGLTSAPHHFTLRGQFGVQ